MSSPGYMYAGNAAAMAPGTPGDTGDTSWWDYPEALRTGASQVGAAGASLIQYLAQENPELANNASQWRQFFTTDEQNAIDSESPEAQRELQASMTSADFWRHPIRAPMLNAIQMSPMIAAAAAGAALAPEGLAAAATGAAIGGGLNVGFGLDDVYKILDTKSDADLQKDNKYYATLRGQGVGEQEARTDLADKMQGVSPLINFATGAGATALGPVGKFLGLPMGTAGAGLIRRIVTGAGEAGAGMALQSGVMEATSQYAQQQLDPTKQFDPAAIATAVLSGAASGAALGGAFGVLPHPGEAPAPKKGEAPVVGPDETQQAATGPGAQPVPPGDGASTGATVDPMEAALTRDEATQGQPVAGAGGGTQTASMAQEPAAARPDVTPEPAVTPAPVSTIAPETEATQALPEAASAVAAGTTVPESRAALHAQVEQLANRNRAVVVFPKGTKANDLPPVPAGMKRVSGGMKDVATIYYDPERVNGAQVRQAVREGRLNELLGIGPYSKEDVAARVAAGEPAVGVVGRDAQGNEVQSAVGTPSTAPEQAEAIARDPNLTVGVEHPADTLAARAADRAAEGGTPETAEVRPAAEALKPATEEAAAPPTVEKTGEKAAEQPSKPAEKVTPEGKKVLRAPVDPAVKARIEAAENERVRQQKEAKAAQAAAETKQAEADAEHEVRRAARAQGVDEDTAVAALKAGKGAKKSAEARARRVNSNENARRVTEAHPPVEAERTYRRPGKGGDDARKAILSRARTMVREAEEAGVEKPVKIRAAEDPAYGHNASVILLDEARRLIKAADETKSGMPGVAKFDHFLAREAELRGAKLEDVNRIIKERSAEGAAKKKPVPKTETEEAPTERVADVTTESPEEALLTKEAQAEGEGEETPEKEAGGREREPVKLTGGEHTAVKSKEGTFKTETKRRRITRAGKDDVKISEAGGKPGGWTRAEGIAYAKKLGEILRKYKATRIKDELGRLVGAKTDLTAKLDPYLRARITRIAGNVRVYRVTPEEMARLRGSDDVRGFYFYAGDEPPMSIPDITHDTVVIRSDLEGDELRHVMQHEAVHAAVQHVINTDSKARAAIERLMDHTIQSMQHDPNLEFEVGQEGYDNIKNSIYGFQDPHEFISEAMSNPDFQKILARYDAPPDAVNRLTNLKLGNMAQAVVAWMRKYLGMPDNQHTQSVMENAFRLTDNLFDKAVQRQTLLGQFDRRVMDPTINMNAETPAQKAAAERAANAVDPRVAKLEEKANPLPAEAIRIATISNNVDKGAKGAAEMLHSVTDPIAVTNKAMSVAAMAGRKTGDTGRWILHNLLTFTQLTDANKGSIPMGPEISRTMDKVATLSTHLKETGQDLLGDLVAFGRKYPGLAEKANALIHDQTMYGVDAKSALGEGRNSYIDSSKEYDRKLAKGLTDIEHETAMNQWASRNAHPELKERYDELVKQAPEWAKLQDRTFKYFEDTQREMRHEQIDTIMQGYGFKGTDAERTAIRDQLYNGKVDQDLRDRMEASMGKGAAKQLADATHLQVKKGPYAPLMRHGDHAVIGRYKVTDTGKAINKPDANTWEFKTRKDAYDFVKANKNLYSNTETAYYDPKTKERVTKMDESKTGSPEQRFAVKLQADHLEFHDTAEQARQAHDELKASGLFDKLATEERRRDQYTSDQFTDAGTQALLKSLEQTEGYQKASTAQKELLRNTVIETGLRNTSDNRVQNRRLPRRNVRGASNDLLRNMEVYNNSQANFRARMKFRPQLDDLMKQMEDHVTANRYNEGNAQRREIANEIQRRVSAQNPDETTGAYTKFTRKLMMYSYVADMVRASHLMLHQTHLPMITAPVVAGRHGVFRTYGMIAKTWRELRAAYGAGGRDFVSSLKDAMHKGTNYQDLLTNSVKDSPDGKRVADMFNTLVEEGVIHPQAGYEFGKYLPHEGSKLPGFAHLDRAVERVDTVFRHLTNATEAINRFVGATSAYRLEYDRLTRAGKSSADAHAGAVDYARDTINNTQGKYTPNNAAPIFKNKWLRPFLQFKQFPQMMYHLIGKLAVDALKGETTEVKVQAIKSLALLLGSHMAMAGVLQGLPLEPFKLLAYASKQLGLTSGDWNDVEDSVRGHLIDTFGKQTADVMTNGLGASLFGVDVHHRLGLNSFYTYGLPDTTDDAHNAQFILSTLAGAPGGMAYDAYKGIKMMLNAHDYQGVLDGGLQLMPSQALRDTQQAIFGGDKPSGYQPDTVDRFKRLIGFTPAADAEAARREGAVFRAVSSYNQERRSLIKEWTSAPPDDREEIWNAIQSFNQNYPRTAWINRGTLMKAMVASQRTSKVSGVGVNKQTKALAEQEAGLY